MRRAAGLVHEFDRGILRCVPLDARQPEPPGGAIRQLIGTLGQRMQTILPVRTQPMKNAVLLAAMILAAASCDDRMPPEPLSNSSYHDNTGRDDVLSGGVRMIPITTPKGTFKVWTKRVGNNPAMKVLLLHGGPGLHARIFRGVRQLLPRRRHRVLLLRPARLLLQRPADGSRPVGSAPLRRGGRAGADGARPRQGQLLSVWAVVGRHARDRVRPQVPAESEGPHHLEHDVEHSRVRRVRREGPDAGDGPEGPGRGQGDRGQEGLCESALHGAADARTTISSTSCACPRTSGPIRSTAPSST